MPNSTPHASGQSTAAGPATATTLAAVPSTNTGPLPSRPAKAPPRTVAGRLLQVEIASTNAVRPGSWPRTASSEGTYDRKP